MWRNDVAVIAISGLLTTALNISPTANATALRWSGIVYACNPPLAAKEWGNDLCDFLESEARKQSHRLGVPLARSTLQKAGPSGSPSEGSISFQWGPALRMLAMLEPTRSVSYPWSLALLFYEHTPDAAGQYDENRWRIILRQDFTLLQGQESKSAKDTVPAVMNNILVRLLSAK